jgi:hypothetical protein
MVAGKHYGVRDGHVAGIRLGRIDIEVWRTANGLRKRREDVLRCAGPTGAVADVIHVFRRGHHRAGIERNVIAADAGRAGLIGRIELRQRIVSAIPSAGRARIQALAGISITVRSHP